MGASWTSCVSMFLGVVEMVAVSHSGQDIWGTKKDLMHSVTVFLSS